MRTEVESGTPLPEKGILFLGGHPNMTKKLRQQFPKWTFVSDDQLRKCSCANSAAVFTGQAIAVNSRAVATFVRRYSHTGPGF